VDAACARIDQNRAQTARMVQAAIARSQPRQQLVASRKIRLRTAVRYMRAVLLWGGPAQKYRRHLTNPGHLVIESAHPSPLSAYRGFLGSRPFSRVNDWLAARGEPPVDWGGSTGAGEPFP